MSKQTGGSDVEQSPPRARFAPADTVDFVIVGSGAAGGIIAKELATAGLSVVVLEQGPRLTEKQFDHDEFATFMQGRWSNHPSTQPQSFRTSASANAETALAAIYGRLVGGSNAHFTGNFWRMRPLDFNEASVLGGATRHGTRRLADHLRGARAVLHQGRVGTWRVGRTRAVRSPALEAVPDALAADQVVGRAVRQGGASRSAFTRSRRRWPSTRAITTADPRASTAASACSSCASSDSKSSSFVTTLPIAEATGKCEVRPDSYVARIETNSEGRVTGVAYFDGKKQMQLQRARAVVLCANGAESPRLLLNSESTRFPNGLANSSGMVGKHLMFNTYFGVNAQFEQPLNEHKSVQNTRMMLDFYATDPKRGFYGGGGIDARFGKYPITFALGGLPPGSPTWGEDSPQPGPSVHADDVFGTHGTSLPLETNSVSIDPSLKDAWGLPCIRVTYSDHPNDLKTAEFLGARALEIAQAAGALKAWPDPVAPQTNSVHLLGTCRMGNDPKSFVIDRFIGRTTCGNCSSATEVAWSPRHVVSRPRRFARSPSEEREKMRSFAKRGEI